MPKLILPQYGKHIMFLGATGTGKSQLAQTMLRQYEKYFVFDTQDSLELQGYKMTDPKALNYALPIGIKRLIYVPKLQYRETKVYNWVFERLLNSSSKKKKRERIIYIDEIYHLGYGAGFPSWISKGITTARQRGLSFWISSQRPRNIPGPIMTEASEIYVFMLSKEEDIDYVSRFARKDRKQFFNILMEQEDDFSFIKIDPRKGTWEKFPKLKLRSG